MPHDATGRVNVARAGALMLLRLLPGLCLAAMAAALAILRAANMAAYLKALWWLDQLPAAMPFGDADAVLTAGRCWRHGVNVYQPNGCMHGGVFNYSPLLLHLLPGTAWSAGVWLAGFGELALVLVALTLLPPPASRLELATRCVASMSSAVVVAAATGNIDTLIFAFAIAGLTALSAGDAAGRAAAYALFAILAAIKFYPVALLSLVLRERKKHFTVYAGIGILGGGLLLLFAHGGILAALSIVPVGPPFIGTFGASNLADGAFVFFGQPRHLAGLMTGLMILLAFAIAWRRAALVQVPSDEAHKLLVLGGAAVLVLCFISSRSYFYRGIFFLAVFPGLFSLDRKWLAGGVLLLMWETSLRAIIPFVLHFGLKPMFLLWLAFEALWWLVMIELAALLLRFARQETGRLLHA